MSGIKRFFAVDPKRSGKPAPQETSKEEVVNLASDSDVEMVDVAPSQPSQKTSQSKPVNRSPSKQKNAQTSSPSGEKNVNPKAAAPKTDSAPQTAAEILDSIPSAELPEVDDASKPNFRQIMQQRQSTGSTESGSGIEINAAPNCLTGLTFVVTGQLPTLGREEIQGLIKRYGGNVTGSLSGKTSCLVLGEEAGPAKIQKAKKLNLKVLSEEGFIQLLQAMPAEGGDSHAADLARAKRAKEHEQIEKETKRIKLEASAPAKSKQDTRSDAKDSSNASELWTTKYAPKSMNDMVGNTGSIRKLANWLENWYESRNGKRSEGSEFRAAMLSGPPGIGKTTAAHLIGKLAGYDVIEYNASDTRSKSLLHTHVAQTLRNSSLSMSAQGKPRTQKLMVVMDEVDGMSAGDRGGVGAMAALARTTEVPLVLICNERTLPKMRPFDRSVFDIMFRRPDASQVRQRLMSIARVEGLELDSNAVEQLTQATRSDIRQMLNLLETYSTTQKSMSYDGSKKFSKSWNKEVALKPFDIAARLLSRASQNTMSTNEKMELYFHDYDFAPLMLQENYLNTSPSLEATAEAASSISDGDLVDKFIHGPQQMWSLMPLHDLTSCVIPAYAAAGQARGRFNFTSYLGNNSKATKYRRLLAELRSHMRLKLATDSTDLRLEMQPLLAFKLLAPLLMKGTDTIPEVIDFMDEYFITKEDWDVIMELGVGPNNTEDMAKRLPTAVKSAFTRKYNAMSHPLPFMKSMDSKAAAVSGRKPEVPDFDEVIPEDTGADEPEVKEETLDEAMKNDKYIKAKAKPRAAKSSAKKAPAKKTRGKK